MKKSISLVLSMLMLWTATPTNIFAQEIESQHLKDLKRWVAETEETLSKKGWDITPRDERSYNKDIAAWNGMITQEIAFISAVREQVKKDFRGASDEQILQETNRRIAVAEYKWSQLRNEINQETKLPSEEKLNQTVSNMKVLEAQRDSIARVAASLNEESDPADISKVLAKKDKLEQKLSNLEAKRTTLIAKLNMEKHLLDKTINNVKTEFRDIKDKPFKEEVADRAPEAWQAQRNKDAFEALHSHTPDLLFGSGLGAVLSSLVGVLGQEKLATLVAVPSAVAFFTSIVLFLSSAHVVDEIQLPTTSYAKKAQLLLQNPAILGMGHEGITAENLRDIIQHEPWVAGFINDYERYLDIKLQSPDISEVPSIVQLAQYPKEQQNMRVYFKLFTEHARQVQTKAFTKNLSKAMAQPTYKF